MLLELNVKNFALIEKTHIEFHEGFNVFLGETGSGKSIIIDAINFLLGGKFNKNFLRTGEEKTFVEGIFTVENINSRKVLDALSIEYDDIIVISRESTKYGKSMAKVNGKTIVLSSLKELSKTFMDIHGQHESQSLLKVSTHIQYMDYFGKEFIDEILYEYKLKYNDLKHINEKIKILKEKKQDDLRRLEFLKFQIDDISKVNPSIGEEEELNDRYKILNNSEQIEKNLTYSYNILYNSNNEFQCVFDLINIVMKNLRSVEDNHKDIKRICDSFQEIYYIIEQNIHDLVDIKDNMNYDRDELDSINERIYILDALKKKYGSTMEEVLSYKNQLMDEFHELNDRDNELENLESKQNEIKKYLKEKGEELHRLREMVSKNLGEQIEEEFKYVGLEKVRFKVEVIKEDSFNENGMDTVKFLICTNPGEPFKSMEEIVSGGELSRIMLSLKSVFIHKDMIDSVVFDEIDTGISGGIAQRVGCKMFTIAKNRQVFCITHLPQIAAMADYCYLIWKEVIEDKTYSNIRIASEDEKVKFIAKMLGGDEITELSIEHSQELLQLAKDNKEKL